MEAWRCILSLNFFKKIKVKNIKIKFITFLFFSLFLTNLPVVFAEDFKDVKTENSHYLAISYLKEKGIITGYEDNSFKPDKEINRAEALKIITLATNAIDESTLNEKVVEEAPFSDSPPEAWFSKYLAAAKEQQLINGHPDGSFKPFESINLAESLKILLKADQKDLNFENLEYENLVQLLFADTPDNEWFTPYTKYAGSLEILDIKSDNTISPEKKITRGYLSEIIYRLQKSKDGYKFGKATWYGSAINGSGTASGEIFDSSLPTAAHKTLPFGTIVEVSNLANGKSVNVTINDRGPYGHGRVLDLSSGAFEKIASLGSGIIYIQYKIIHLP